MNSAFDPRYSLGWWQGRSGKYHWHLVSRRNGKVMCQGEPNGYDSKANCFRAMATCKRAFLKVAPAVYVGGVRKRLLARSP